MNSQNNNSSGTNKNDVKANANSGPTISQIEKKIEKRAEKKNDSNVHNDFSNAVQFCRNNLRYLAAAGLFIVIVVLLVKSSASSAGSPNTAPSNADNTVLESTEPEVAPEPKEPAVYAKDAYPEINELVDKYYTAYADNDVDALTTLTENLSEIEKSYIAMFSEYVEEYDNISCYTKPGADDTSYLVSVYLEMKLKDIETKAPGLEFLYVRTRADGSLYIDQRYSQLNLSRHDQELEPEVEDLIDAFKQQDDLIALQNQVWESYYAAVDSDEELRVMAETTIRSATAVWVSDQAAAARAAQEEAERLAAEEQKAAEEEAARQAEEERKAAELAAAVTVYATSKVNVRAEASEEAEIIGQLELGAQSTRLEEKDGWSRIDYSNGTEGYVKSDYLTTDSSAVASSDDTANENSASGGLAEWSKVTLSETVNIRESMSTDSAKLATAYSGEQVTVVMSYAEGWTKVTYGDIVGYIKTDLLK